MKVYVVMQAYQGEGIPVDFICYQSHDDAIKQLHEMKEKEVGKYFYVQAFSLE